MNNNVWLLTNSISFVGDPEAALDALDQAFALHPPLVLPHHDHPDLVVVDGWIMCIK
jgi:hypothetical protein